MPAHIDAPTPGSTVDPLWFYIRGWLWLGSRQDEIAAVGAWCGDALLGETATLAIRPDVSAALALPAGTRTGFEFFARHPAAVPQKQFSVQVRGRFRDGSEAPALATFDVAAGERESWLERPATAPVGRTHEDRAAHWLAPLERAGGIGVEIGAAGRPVPGIEPIYVDCYTSFGDSPVSADYYGHACSLPFRDNSLDYVASSHVIEHVADPIAALAEWYRVLRPGGLIYMVVPDRRFTWDSSRPLTTVEHLLSDHERGTTPADDTHIDDFVHIVDWSRFLPSIPSGEVPARKLEMARVMHESVARGLPVNIHFHVFEPANVLALLDALRGWKPTRFDWQIVDHAERYPAGNPDGFLVVVRVNKSWSDKIESWWHRFQTRRDRKHPLRPGAEPFAEFAKKCAGIGGVR